MQYPSPYSLRAISQAIINGELPNLERLFREMPNIEKAVPALCMAIHSGVPVKTEAAEFVINSFVCRRVDINLDGGVLLQACIRAENISLVELCLKSGANPNVLYDDGFSLRSPLATAVSLGWDDDRRSRPRNMGEDARAAAIIELLLDKGADLSEKGVICKAVGNRSLDVIKKLIMRGGSVNERNDKGQTPLFFCANSLPVARYLISMGADINAWDAEGRTPLMGMAFSFKTDVKVILLLLKSGAEINAQNRFGQTALMFAASAGRKIVIDELLKHGADISLKNNRQKTALDSAEESPLREAGVVELIKKDVAQ
jgi:uncharacterized protein